MNEIYVFVEILSQGRREEEFRSLELREASSMHLIKKKYLTNCLTIKTETL